LSSTKHGRGLDNHGGVLDLGNLEVDPILDSVKLKLERQSVFDPADVQNLRQGNCTLLVSNRSFLIGWTSSYFCIVILQTKGSETEGRGKEFCPLRAS
jgi:hypothetical protein